MSARQQFSMIVQAVPVMRISAPPDLGNTILRTCQDCLELTPHYVSADSFECAVCGFVTYKRTPSVPNGELDE